MPDVRNRRSWARLLVSATGGWLVLGGCGGSENETVIPTDPADLPENKAMDSMNFYRQQKPASKKPGAAK